MMLWIVFAITVVAMLALDLGVANRRSHVVTMKTALAWSAFWIVLALLFNLLVYFVRGEQTALEFFTAYIVEESLSVDNLFVFLLIFSYFSVPREYQHKVLFWGIMGVMIMRGIFIFAGVALISRFGWMIYIFGGFLVLTGIKMLFEKDKKIDPGRNPILKLFRRMMPVTEIYEEDRFFVKRAGRVIATPLFVVVLVIETTDVIFAVDSIPAVLGISVDPLVVYTSNIFAVLGLRSLFFALSGFMEIFHHLHYGLSVILAFVGVKMLIAHYYKMPIGIALGIVAGILVISVVASLIWPKQPECHPERSEESR